MDAIKEKSAQLEQIAKALQQQLGNDSAEITEDIYDDVIDSCSGLLASIRELHYPMASILTVYGSSVEYQYQRFPYCGIHSTIYYLIFWLKIYNMIL